MRFFTKKTRIHRSLFEDDADKTDSSRRMHVDLRQVFPSNSNEAMRSYLSVMDGFRDDIVVLGIYEFNASVENGARVLDQIAREICP